MNVVVLPAMPRGSGAVPSPSGPTPTAQLGLPPQSDFDLWLTLLGWTPASAEASSAPLAAVAAPASAVPTADDSAPIERTEDAAPTMPGNAPTMPFAAGALPVAANLAVALAGAESDGRAAPDPAAGSPRFASAAAAAPAGAITAAMGEAAAPAPPPQRVWHVEELAHRIRDAWRAAERSEDEPNRPAATPGGPPARAPRTQGLPSQAVPPEAAGVLLAERPNPATGPNTATGVVPVKAESPADAATAGNAPKPSAEPRGESLAAAGLRLPVIEWHAPAGAAAADAGAPTADFAEQWRQASEFLARYVGGVVRLGERGVEANLRLYPPDLGGVRVALEVRADLTATATFTVERAETAALLREHLDRLRESMGRHGLALDRVTVVAPERAAAPGAPSSGPWADPRRWPGDAAPHDGAATSRDDPRRERDPNQRFHDSQERNPQ